MTRPFMKLDQPDGLDESQWCPLTEAEPTSGVAELASASEYELDIDLAASLRRPYSPSHSIWQQAPMLILTK